MTAWGANWLDPERLPVRLLLVGLMFASLLMSAGIGEAFAGRAWLFVTGYLALQVGRATFLLGALRGTALGGHFVNDLVWELLAGAFWVAGAVADGDARLVLWWIAVAVTYGGGWSLHWLPGRGRFIDLAHTGISGGHLVERFRLFFIIVLGETVLRTGSTFTSQPFTAERLATLAIAFGGSVALWWCYFARTEALGLEAAAAAEDAGTVGWWGTQTLSLIVLAVIGIAVGDQLAVAGPGDDTTLGFTALAFGGPALFLLAQLLFLGEALERAARSRLLGIAALALLAAATAPLTLIAGIAAAAAVLVAVALADATVGRTRRDAR
jgi:low temperature requirement protein LtrA